MGFSFDPGEPTKTKILKKLSSYFKKNKTKQKTKTKKKKHKKKQKKNKNNNNILMTDHLIRNNLRKKELVVIESKQKLQSFILRHPHSIFLLLTLYFLRKVSMNYNIRFKNVLVMHKIYVLGLCDHIQLKTVNIMQVCIVAQVLLISSIWHLHLISHVKI